MTSKSRQWFTSFLQTCMASLLSRKHWRSLNFRQNENSPKSLSHWIPSVWSIYCTVCTYRTNLGKSNRLARVIHVICWRQLNNVLYTAPAAVILNFNLSVWTVYNRKPKSKVRNIQYMSVHHRRYSNMGVVPNYVMNDTLLEPRESYWNKISKCLHQFTFSINLFMTK